MLPFLITRFEPQLGQESSGLFKGDTMSKKKRVFNKFDINKKG